MCVLAQELHADCWQETLGSWELLGREAERDSLAENFSGKVLDFYYMVLDTVLGYRGGDLQCHHGMLEYHGRE